MSFYFNPEPSGHSPNLEKPALDIPWNLGLAAVVLYFYLVSDESKKNSSLHES